MFKENQLRHYGCPVMSAVVNADSVMQIRLDTSCRGIIVGIICRVVPDFLFLRRNLVSPPPPPQASLSLPLDTKGGGGVYNYTLACGWGVGGNQFGRLERKPGTLYTLCSYLDRILAFGSKKCKMLQVPRTLVLNGVEFSLVAVTWFFPAMGAIFTTRRLQNGKVGTVEDRNSFIFS